MKTLLTPGSAMERHPQVSAAAAGSAADSTQACASCPLCDSHRTVLVRSIQSRAIVDLWQKKYSIEVGKSFRNLAAFDLLQCEDCSLKYFSPAWLAGSPELYAQLEKFDWYYM